MRRPETQARLSIALALASIAPVLLQAYFVLSRLFDTREYMIYHGSRFKFVVFGCGMAALGLAVIGFGFGYASAGQRRNEKQKLSWLGFFIAAGVMTVAVLLLCVFYFRGESVIV
jgi:hypothetical protein